MRKMKKTTGEILDVNEICEKNDRYVKNFGIWIKYNSRSGTCSTRVCCSFYFSRLLPFKYLFLFLRSPFSLLLALQQHKNHATGTHNMYREYRSTTLTNAVDNLYNDMAGRHRARNKSIQIIKTATVEAKDCKRVSTTQFHAKGLKFPLPHRIMRPATKQVKALFSANRPNTHFQ